MNNLKRIAVVIDADNTQVSKLEDVLREVSTRGRIVVKRAYGNWRKDILKNWEEVVKRLAIKAEQQFDYVAGKNATDMALVIGTLELLHSGIYDGFVIVSSDSDYTPLAIKLRESGVYVMGIGEKKTPESFRNSCDEFLFLENFCTEESCPCDEKQPHRQELEAEKSVPGNDLPLIHSLLEKAYETYQGDDGYVLVSTAGSFIHRTKPDFDPRTYGFRKFTDLLDAFPERYRLRKVSPDVDDGSVVASYRCLEQKH